MIAGGQCTQFGRGLLRGQPLILSALNRWLSLSSYSSYLASIDELSYGLRA